MSLRDYLGEQGPAATEKTRTCLATKTCYNCGGTAEWIPVFVATASAMSGILFQAAPFCMSCVVQPDFEKNCDELRKELFLAGRRKGLDVTMRNYQVTMVKLI